MQNKQKSTKQILWIKRVLPEGGNGGRELIGLHRLTKIVNIFCNK